MEELLQLGYHRWIHLGMDAPLASCQALVKYNIEPQTVKSSGGIEVQVILADFGREVEEALHQLQLRQRVRDEAVSIYDVELLHREELQPALQVFGVDAGPHRFVLCVHLTGTGINSQLLKLVVGLVFALLALKHLCVVRYGSDGGLTHNDQQFDGGVHLEDAFRDLLCDEVSRTLLNSDLMGEG